MAGEFDLYQLLAGPIIAMNDAQADAAASFYELFEQFAFEPAVASDDASNPRGPRSLRMISFIAERATEGRIERREISMPVLQMIPMGGVAIDSAKIEFSLAINAEPPPASRAPGQPAASLTASRAVALKGRIAPAAASDAATAGNLRVEIMLKQIDLPAGYLDMIAETQGGMSRRLPESPVKAEEEAQDPAKGQEGELFSVSVEDAADRMVPGTEYGLSLHIVPNGRLVGEEALRLALSSDPKRALRIVAPKEAVILLGREPRTERVQVEPLAGRDSRSEIALVLDGSAVGPDGVKRQHQARIVLPPAKG